MSDGCSASALDSFGRSTHALADNQSALDLQRFI